MATGLMAGQPLQRSDLEQLINEVGDVLAAQQADHRAIVVVGGSYLALRGLRDATRDVDVITVLDDELRQAIETVAERHDLSLAWINANARPFAPQGLDMTSCTVLVEHPAITVLGPPARWVFLMKLYAARPGADHHDMVALWAHTDFVGPDDAVEAFYEAYPLEEFDPHLIDYVTNIANRPHT